MSMNPNKEIKYYYGQVGKKKAQESLRNIFWLVVNIPLTLLQPSLNLTMERHHHDFLRLNSQRIFVLDFSYSTGIFEVPFWIFLYLVGNFLSFQRVWAFPSCDWSVLFTLMSLLSTTAPSPCFRVCLKHKHSAPMGWWCPGKVRHQNRF